MLGTSNWFVLLFIGFFVTVLCFLALCLNLCLVFIVRMNVLDYMGKNSIVSTCNPDGLSESICSRYAGHE